MIPRTHRFALFVLVTFAFFVGEARSRADESKSPIYVILWFDTEDYVLPASDDAALRVADFLSKEEIRATFKVVGEKARRLEQRKREDVIKALSNHEIGYHSNYHSVQPSPAMYLDGLGWDEGVAEFDRREKQGYDDVKRILGQAPSCYGQPGSSWGPQTYGGMKKWGMEVYLDSGSHVQLDNKPCYYCGLLNLYRLAYTLRADLNNPKDLENAQTKFADARKALQAEGGGIVSIFYHPCEFVHKQFWDGANFSKGANPPLDKLTLPKAKTEEESKVSYQIFEDYIRFIKRFPDVKFITAKQAARIYRDKARGRKFSIEELKALATGIQENVTFQKCGDFHVTAGESFFLLNEYVLRHIAGKAPESLDLTISPLGPTGTVANLSEAIHTDASQFSRTAVDVADYLAKHQRLPGQVWLGSVAVPPEAYIQALAKVCLELIAGKPMPERIEVKPAKLAAEAHVAPDNPKLWGWVIFPPGFHAPALMELARKQAWTIKPAVLVKD
jgi:Polysaccharide deacetylase